VERAAEQVTRAASGFQAAALALAQPPQFAQLAQFTQRSAPGAGAFAPFDIGAFVPRLPDLGPLIRLWEEAERRRREALRELKKGRRALDESGFGFAEGMWDAALILALSRIQPSKVGAAATSQSLAVIRSSGFQSRLEKTLTGSRLLRRRWEPVRAGLQAHLQRNYALSVPALTLHVEGLVGDLLVLKREVKVVRGRCYRLDASGKIKLDKKGKPVEVRGLAPLITSSGLAKHRVLKRLAEFITTSLTDDRNALYHGRSTRYASAKHSAQALLLIVTLAEAVRKFETGRLN
jgi:hypothetical protein